MKKALACLVMTLFVVGASFGLALAQDNAGDGAVSQVITAQGTVDFQLFGADAIQNLNSVVSILCKTDVKPISVQVNDCCIAGDIFAATISKKSGKKVDRTSNQDAAGVALPADVFSDPVSVASKKVIIHVSPANNVPAGLPAGMTVRVTSPGTLECTVQSRDDTF